MRYLLNIMMTCAAAAGFAAVSWASVDDAPRIARWYQNHDGAVSLRFDDSLESHITTAIPLLNRHGFRAVFMVNPGLSRYESRKVFWEQQAPAMGHRLGNHTMNHRGARNLQEAEYEIGEAARVIWRVHAKESRLLVFASGGGENWGGREWEQADQSYLLLAKKYHQIDLYDGKHRSRRVDARSQTADLCALLDAAADEKRHQPFHFHQVGSPSFKDVIRKFVSGSDLSFSEENFSAFLHCIDERKERLWVAPLIDILKYEEEARGVVIKVLSSTPSRETVALGVKTDPVLYDHPLTMIMPVRRGMAVRKVMQGNKELHVYQRRPGEDLVDARPRNSTLTIIYTSAAGRTKT